MKPMDQLVDSIRQVQEMNKKAGWIAIDAVTAAAEVFHMMMTSGVTVEWCRKHGRPFESCPLFEQGFLNQCDPHVHVLGPKMVETRD